MRFVIFFFVLLSITPLVKAQNTISQWSGKLAVGTQTIEMRLHFNKEADQTTKVSLDVPVQKAMGINASNVSIHEDSVVLEFGLLKSIYKGKYIQSDSIAGIWIQSGMQFPLSFKSVNAFEEKVVNRPQTPKPPFSYKVEELVYTGKKTGLDYGVTITYPSKEGKYPMVILITGSGQQDRDESIFEHKPFAVIADYLTKNGMAVMRVDDRGKGKSTGVFAESNSYDFSEDVEEHIAYAKALSFVDSKKIGLLGHSEGGMIAPMVAARNKDVAFTILMAGPGIDIIHLMELQNKNVLLSAGISKEAVNAYLPLYVNIMKLTAEKEEKSVMITKTKELVTNWYATVDKQVAITTAGLKDTSDISKFASTIVGQLSTKWWKYFISYNPAENLSKVKCPLLALNGSKDIQVIADVDLNGIEDAMKMAKNKRYTIKKMDGLNHLFQKCNACTVKEYGDIETTIEPIVLSTILQWLQEVQVL